MPRISPTVLRNRFHRIMGDAGFDVSSPAYFSEGSRTDGTYVRKATIGHTFLARGAMGGWYIGQYVNDGGAERNLCGSWSVLSVAEMMVWLDAVEMMHNRSRNIHPCA